MEKAAVYRERLEYDKICAAVRELAVSEQGKRLAEELEPSADLMEASAMLEVTDALCKMLAANGGPSVSAVDGVKELALRAQKGGLLSMGELLRVKTVLRNARALHAWYSSELDGEGYVNRLFYLLFEDAQLEREIGSCILSETEMSDEASAELASIRRKIAKAESSVRDKLDSIIHSSDSQKYLQDALVTMRGGRFVVPVKQEFRSQVSGLVHDVSSTGATYFIEPQAVVEANNLIMQLHGDELKEIDRILGQFTDRVAAIAEMLANSFDTFTQIDLALAKAKYSLQIEGVKPKLNAQGRIDLHRARHPLIDTKTVVPIDLPLGAEYTSLVITGPNTGGKTVTLQPVGLLSRRAARGLLVPARENSELCVFSKVLVDIGDEQSIEQSLSTFSAHIRSISEILREADESSLVLLDELGAGTDPAEGAALAVAILERLRRCGCRLLATTHYGEIKLYAIETPGVQNASCEFDVATLRPTYRLMIGIPGKSNALLIGERLGLDRELLDDARRNMGGAERRFEDALDEIERLKTELADKQRELDGQKDAAKKLAEKGKAEYDRLVAQGQREMDAARRKARQLANDVSASAYKLLDEIKKLDAQKEKDRQAAKQRAKAIANRESAKLYDESDPVEELRADDLPPVDPKKLRAGDSVFVVPIGQIAAVVSGPDAKGSVEVKAGLIRTRVPADALRIPPAQRTKAAKPLHRLSASVEEKRSGKNEINLLGMTTDEAVMEAERFIDSALLSHLSTVYLIHGKGTGALRAALHKDLKTLKCVKSFRLGKYGEGEDGVTIVELA